MTTFISVSTVNVFRGNETSLKMSQLYSATYTCDFYLAMFPFDTQVGHTSKLRCTIVVFKSGAIFHDERDTFSRAGYTCLKNH